MRIWVPYIIPWHVFCSMQSLCRRRGDSAETFLQPIQHSISAINNMKATIIAVLVLIAVFYFGAMNADAVSKVESKTHQVVKVLK